MADTKILYEPKEGTTGFWGLRNFPDKPFPDQSEWNYHKKYSAYKTTLESCKSNKLEIVNPEVIGVTEDSMNQCLHIKGKYLKPGDIFDLPIGYEFKEEWHDPCIKAKDCLKPEDGWKCMFICKIGSMKVLRLVAVSQPEPEESQPMTTDWIDLIAIASQVEKKGFVETQKILSKYFTIQRKKQ